MTLVMNGELDLTARLSELLQAAPAEYVAPYLFGSRARGTAGPRSDVDLGFWRSSPGGSSLADQPFDYAATLSLALRVEVDLVELNRAPVDLVHRVLRDGKLAGFRNLVVHGYADVDMKLVARILSDNLGDLASYAAAVRKHLGSR